MKGIVSLVLFLLVVAFLNRDAITEWIWPEDTPAQPAPTATVSAPTQPASTATPAPIFPGRSDATPALDTQPTPDRQDLELLAVAAGERCSGLTSLEQVAWETYPSVDEAGRLTMSGRLEGDGPRIKDARKSVNRTRHPAFTFYAREDPLNERGRLSSVGRLWPSDIEGSLSGRGSPNAFADVYDVTADRFDVAATLPNSILQHQDLHVLVWSELVETLASPQGSTAAVGGCRVWR